MADKKLRPVKQIKTHIGIQVAGNVFTSLNADKHKCQMELHPVGVMAMVPSHADKRVYEILIPYANIQVIELLEE